MIIEFIEDILAGALSEQCKLQVYGHYFLVERKEREALPSWRSRIAERMRKPLGGWWLGSDNLPAWPS